ncbi:MAG: hypothetical protein L6R43_16340, partial [Planctomycetes bacterium]|nr:hypothetical protein [Planctomycetota bacterium]
MPLEGRAAASAVALLFLSAAALPGGCSSLPPSLDDSALLSQGRVVHEAPPGAPRAPSSALPPATAPEAAAAADRAEALLAAGDAAGALEEVRPALLRQPPGPEGERLRDIRLRAKRAFLRSSVARASVLAPDRETEGWPLRVKVLLHNLSPAPLLVEAPPPGASPATVRLRVVRTARDVAGNVRTEEWEQLLPLAPGSAPPGGSLGAEAVVETERFRDLVPHGFVTYDFGGEVLLSAMRAGRVDLADRIPLEGGRTTTFPQRGWREVAGDPEGHLERGLRERNPVRVLVAAGLLPEGARAAAAAGLARRLRDDGGLGAAAGGVRAALRFLGDDPEADAWTVERWEERAAAAA